MKRFVYVMIFAVALQAWSESPDFKPPVNRNAALRYWMAFADLQDRPADAGTTKLIEDVLSGSASWDEQRLGPIMEANEAAVLSMQRASTLPECDWGLEYSRGAAMSVGHLPKARVLARLNALYGARQMAKGDTAGAVATWLAGLRFAQCVAHDMGLIGVLSAKPALMANLHLLTRAAQSGVLNSDMQEKTRAQLRHLPDEGLDWVASLAAEGWACEEGLRYLAKAPNFQETYKAFFNTPPPQPAHPPTEAEIADFHSWMAQVEAAFQLPYAQTQERLKKIMTRRQNMNPAVDSVIPNFERLNETRHELALEQENLEKALGGK